VTSIGNAAFEGCPWQPPKKGCFITTAVCSSFSKSDDCRELTTFRAFRDNWLAKQPDGQSLITEYYRIAPGIVAAINKGGNQDAVYRGIWDTYLADCMRLIENREFAACKQRYIAMIESLKITYTEAYVNDGHSKEIRVGFDYGMAVKALIEHEVHKTKSAQLK
jgi:hypothetical protein